MSEASSGARCASARSPASAEARERTLAGAAGRACSEARAPAGRRRLRRPAIVLLAALLVLGTGLSPAGADVRRWIGDRLDPEPSPTLSRLPSGGRLLVSSAQGSWVVRGGRVAPAPRRLLERGLVAARPLRGRGERAAPVRGGA